MTKRLSDGTVIIQAEEDDECEFCKKFDELRPYGPNRERICFDCAMKDEKTTERIMARDVFGITEN